MRDNLPNVAKFVSESCCASHLQLFRAVNKTCRSEIDARVAVLCRRMVQGRNVQLNATITGTATTVTIKYAENAGIAEKSYLQIDDEVVLVKNISADKTSLVIERAKRGTFSAVHGENSTVIVCCASHEAAVFTLSQVRQEVANWMLLLCVVNQRHRALLVPECELTDAHGASFFTDCFRQLFLRTSCEQFSWLLEGLRKEPWDIQVPYADAIAGRVDTRARSDVISAMRARDTLCDLVASNIVRGILGHVPESRRAAMRRNVSFLAKCAVYQCHHFQLRRVLLQKTIEEGDCAT